MSDFKTLLAIGDLMNKNVVLISRDATIKDGAVKMKDESASSLLVIDGDSKLVGIITEQDIIRRAVAEGADLTAVTILEIMSKDPVEINHDESIFEARNIITSKKLNHLVVTKDGKPIGILTSANLLGG